LDNGRIDLICLPWSLANHYILRVPGEACVIRPNVAALAEAIAAQNNQEAAPPLLLAAASSNTPSFLLSLDKSAHKMQTLRS
jgi:hypothetical protein